MCNEDKKSLIEYIDKLNLLDDSKTEVMLLLDEEKYDELREKLNFYIDLEVKKENEFFRIQNAIYEQDSLEQQILQDEEDNNQYFRDVRRVEDLQAEMLQLAREQEMDKIGDEIDAKIAETAKKIDDLGKKYRKKIEEEALSKIQNKLK